MPPPRSILNHMQVFCKKNEVEKSDKSIFFKKKYQKENIFWGWNNNGLILPYLELDLYFMIIYLCVKFEFNTLMFSKDIKLKLFFNVEKGL